MRQKEILSNLCAYDEKNPNNVLSPLSEKDDPEKCKQIEGEDFASEGCKCDNCFYGRTKLATFILKLLKEKDNAKA